jgi:Beta/Gamma crystallin
MKKIFSGLIFLLTASFVFGQVSLFTAEKFKGKTITLGEGSIASLQNTLIETERVTSIRIATGYTVVVYEHQNFKGEKAVFTTSQSYLTLPFSGNPSSFAVYKKTNKNWSESGWSDSKIILYTNCGFTGNKVELYEGGYRSMPTGFAKTLSSIRIPADYKAELYSKPYFSGKKVTLQSDEFCFPSDWNDLTASIQILIKEPNENTNDPWTNAEETENAGSISELIASNSNYSSGGEVIVYADCNYGGKDSSLAVSAFNNVSSLSISSIKIPADKVVMVYSGKNFLGTKTILSRDEACLAAGLNNKILSLKIELKGLGGLGTTGQGSGGGGASGSGGGFNSSGWGSGSGSGASVRVFDNCNFSGMSRAMGDGNYAAMPSGFAKKVSSIRVPAGKRVTVFTGANFAGNSFVFLKDINCLPANWNNKILSMKITKE